MPAAAAQDDAEIVGRSGLLQSRAQFTQSRANHPRQLRREFPHDITTRNCPVLDAPLRRRFCHSARINPTPPDGNVKRVLARYHAVEAGRAKPAPCNVCGLRRATFTQYPQCCLHRDMDKGATLCTRSKPRCSECPLQNDCQALLQGNPQAYPGKRAAKVLPEKTAVALVLCNAAGEVFLQKRPPTGIWGGLWSFPEFADSVQLHTWLQENVTQTALAAQVLPTLTHTFSHYRLHLQPLLVDLDTTPSRIMEGSGWLWYKAGSELAGGLSAAVRSHFQH